MKQAVALKKTKLSGFFGDHIRTLSTTPVQCQEDLGKKNRPFLAGIKTLRTLTLALHSDIVTHERP
jgi:hypothetical protein